jgi:hypothetical protein
VIANVAHTATVEATAGHQAASRRKLAMGVSTAALSALMTVATHTASVTLVTLSTKVTGE